MRQALAEQDRPKEPVTVNGKIGIHMKGAPPGTTVDPKGDLFKDGDKRVEYAPRNPRASMYS